MFRAYLRRILTAIQPREFVVVRLSPAVMADLRRKAGSASSTYVTQHTTDIQAGYMLGVNHVLNILQEGYVHEGAVSPA